MDLSLKLYPYMPVWVKQRIMSKSVVRSYALNNYSEMRESRKLSEHEVEVLDKFLNIAKRNVSRPNVLDIGCGDARLYDVYLSEHGVAITGIDISEEQIQRAKRNLPYATFVKDDFMKYKFENKYDSIVSFYSIYNIPRENHPKLFRKMYRWLNSDGNALVLCRIDGVGDLKYWDDWCGAPMAFSYNGIQSMIHNAKAAGFKVECMGHKDNDEYVWMFLSKED